MKFLRPTLSFLNKFLNKLATRDLTFYIPNVRLFAIRVSHVVAIYALTNRIEYIQEDQGKLLARWAYT